MLSCRFIDTIKPEPGSAELPGVHEAAPGGAPAPHRPRGHPAPSDQQRPLSDLISPWNPLSAFMSPKMILIPFLILLQNLNYMYLCGAVVLSRNTKASCVFVQNLRSCC